MDDIDDTGADAFIGEAVAGALNTDKTSVSGAASGTTGAVATGTTFSTTAGVTVGFFAGSSLPKDSDDLPPGGACKRVDERSMFRSRDIRVDILMMVFSCFFFSLFRPTVFGVRVSCCKNSPQLT